MGFNFEDFSTPQKEEFPGVVLEVGNVPDSWDGEGGGSIQGKAAPVPGEFEGVEDVVKDTEGDEGFV